MTPKLDGWSSVLYVIKEMNNGRNPTRRNRNIGTAKQGHGQNNKLTIPQPWDTDLSFYERIDSPKKQEIAIQGTKVTVITEALKKGYFYSCTSSDVQRILNHLPKDDLEDFEYIIFRQPKKKESILSAVWGRLIYSFEFEGAYGPAIIIEATPKWKTYTYPKKQSVEDALEFELLKKDGMVFKESKRDFVADIDESVIRSVQLYRTLLHEVGHYVHYLDVVQRPEKEDEEIDEREARIDTYFKVPKPEKESFANRYAVEMKLRLTKRGVIPFDKIEDIQSIQATSESHCV
ncbi:MAG: hypothetical protein ACSHX8_14240 [Opitutaceae bacterium]